MRYVLVILAVLLTATSATANTVSWVEGFESQVRSLTCPSGGFADAGTSSKLVTANPTPPSGAGIALLLEKPSSTQGSCGIATGLALTGTVWLYAQVQVVNSVFACQGSVSGVVIDLGAMQFHESCTNSTNTHTWKYQTSGGTQIGSTFAPTEGQWYPITLKTVTGSNGSASAQWWISTDGATWTDQGSTSGLSITNINSLALYGPTTISGGTLVSLAFDDLLLMTGTSPGRPDVITRVAQRRGSQSTPTYNNWSDRTAYVGGNTTYIRSVWTSPVSGREDGALNVTYDTSSPYACQGGSNDGASCTSASQCPGGTCWYGYANSPSGSDTGQTMKFASWDDNGPPVIPSTATQIWGCKADAYVTRHNVGGSTARTIELRRRYNGTNTDSGGLSLTTDTYSVARMIFDTTDGATMADKITNLNGIEFGGIKSASATGLSLEIQDVWLQCAWSEPATSGVFQWVQDDE